MLTSKDVTKSKTQNVHLNVINCPNLLAQLFLEVVFYTLVYGAHGYQSCQGYSSRVKRRIMCSCFIKAPYLVTLNWSGWAPAGGWAVLCSDFFAFSRSFLIKQKEISHQKNHLREREPLPTNVQLKIYITKIFKYCKDTYSYSCI